MDKQYVGMITSSLVLVVAGRIGDANEAMSDAECVAKAEKFVDLVLGDSPSLEDLQRCRLEVERFDPFQCSILSVAA